jgi:hypothetical protein
MGWTDNPGVIGYGDAMKQAAHIPAGVTERMNAVVAAIGTAPGPFSRAAAREVFQRVEWRRE